MSGLGDHVKAAALIAFMMLILVGIPAFCIPGLNYSRRIRVFEHGLILMEDRLLGVGDVAVLNLSFPRRLLENLLDLEVKADLKPPPKVEVIHLSENESYIRISEISPGTEALTLTFIFGSDAMPYGRGLFNLTVPVYPGINLPVDALNFSLYIPGTSSFKERPEGYGEGYNGSHRWLKLSETGLELGAIRFLNVSISGLKPFRVERFRRVVSISEFGEVVVEDFYTILSTSESAISRIDFQLPANASEHGAKDGFGGLETYVSREYPGKLTVEPRFRLQTGDRYSFTVFYKLPALAVDHSLLKHRHSLNLDTWLLLPMVVEEFNLTIRLPEHSTLLKASPGNYTVAEDNSLSWILKDDDAPALSPVRAPPSFTVHYNYNVLWASLKPVLWSSLVIALTVAAYYVRKFRAVTVAVEAKPEVKPVFVEEVLRFVEAYEEKLDLRRELYRLDEQRRVGRISRSEYRTRSSRLRRRLTEVDKLMERYRSAVEKAGYQDELRAIEEAETDISISEVGLRELRNRYRAGRVSREVYRRLSAEYLKRIRRSEGRIRRTLTFMASG